MRPVRLAPCAAGARPTIATRAAGSPKPDGRPRPVLLAAVAPRRVGGARLAPLDQARAAAAGVDLGCQRGQRLATALAHRLSASPWPANRITRGGAARRCRLLVAAWSRAARRLRRWRDDDHGGGPDKAADAEILNNVLARELAAVRAYDRTLPLLPGRPWPAPGNSAPPNRNTSTRSMKALRGLGEPAEPEEEEIESEGLKTQADALAFLYEVESVSDRRRPAGDLPPHRHLAAVAAGLDRRQPGAAPGRAAARARGRRCRIRPRRLRERHGAGPIGDD